MTEGNVLHLLETCSKLKSLCLPFNSKITGWFLESLLERRKKQDWRNLENIKMYINTAYVDIHTVIPELYAETLVNDFSNLSLKLEVNFVHRKLPSFNPKDMNLYTT